MGFMDNFTTDGMVEMKHTEYYNLMREAAKAELIEKAVKAGVPGFYIQAMITGEEPEFPNTLEAEKKSTGFGAEYEQMTGAAVSIFEAWTKENGVESAAACRDRWSCRTCGNCKPVRIDMDLCRNCEDGSNYTKTDDEEEEAHELKEAEGQQEESEGAGNGNE